MAVTLMPVLIISCVGLYNYWHKPMSKCSVIEKGHAFILDKMEVDVGTSRLNENKSMECSILTIKAEKIKDADGEVRASVFVNRAEIAWHESRRKWVGDKSRRSLGNDKDPIISWSTTYDELLSTREPFGKPIPLSEMVDFLVDIWHDEGLYD